MLKVRRPSRSLTRSLPSMRTAAMAAPSRAGPGDGAGRGWRSATPAAASFSRMAGRLALVAS